MRFRGPKIRFAIVRVDPKVKPRKAREGNFVGVVLHLVILTYLSCSKLNERDSHSEGWLTGRTVRIPRKRMGLGSVAVLVHLLGYKLRLQPLV